jgi:hypothetical protein
VEIVSLEGKTYGEEENHSLFFLISQNILRKCKGAQPIVHKTYTRESLRGRR